MAEKHPHNTRAGKRRLKRRNCIKNRYKRNKYASTCNKLENLHKNRIEIPMPCNVTGSGEKVSI